MAFENHPLHPGEGVPIFIAAGPLKDGPQLEPFLAIEDPLVVPVLVSGGWTLGEWAGNATSENPQDFVYYSDKQMAGNARGLPNSGLEGMRQLKEPIRRLSDKGIKVIIQVTNLPHEKPIDVIPNLVEEAALLKPTGVEVNLSCPNGLDDDGNLHPPTCDDVDVSGEVMSESWYRVGDEVVLGAKDSPHAASLESGVNRVAVIRLITAIKPYINFITGINTIGGQLFPELKCAKGKGGMSGPVVAPIAHEWLIAANDALEGDSKVAILSCGGVDSQNASIEIPTRQQEGALLIGGAQHFFRAQKPEQLALRWAQAYADSAE